MKSGYKCDHCSKFSESGAEIEKHEAECSFNNANKCCVACKHYSEGYPFSCPSCEKSVPGFPERYDGDKTDCKEFKEAYPDQK